MNKFEKERQAANGVAKDDSATVTEVEDNGNKEDNEDQVVPAEQWFTMFIIGLYMSQ